jgi:hypothetical protein
MNAETDAVSRSVVACKMCPYFIGIWGTGLFTGRAIYRVAREAVHTQVRGPVGLYFPVDS